MKDLEIELPSLMTFEGDQHIRTSIEISNLVANYTNILSLDLDKVICLLKLRKCSLLKYTQTVSHLTRKFVEIKLCEIGGCLSRVSPEQLFKVLFSRFSTYLPI